MKRFILLAAVAISLAACNNEDNYIEEPVAAHISATIGGNAQSRASDDAWDAGDDIGITMSGRYFNIKYTTENGDGVFDGSVMYFRNKQEQVNITAYYPFTGTEGETPAAIEATTDAEHQTPTEQSKLDFLYAVKENVTALEPEINLSFSHKMSKVTLVFVNGNNGTDVRKITSCEINGLILKGTFNTATGICSASTATPAAALSMAPAVVDNKVSLSLIFFPQAVDKVTMKITDSQAQEYSCELKFTGDRLESGNNYLYTITVKKTGLIVNPCKIAEWTVVDSDPDDPEKPLGSEAVSD